MSASHFAAMHALHGKYSDAPSCVQAEALDPNPMVKTNGAACQKAGVADFTWHCLRHTFASRLVMAAVGLQKVQELIGHKTIPTTCQHAHLSPKHQLEAVLLWDGWGRKSGNETGTKTDTSRFEAPAPRLFDSPQVAVG